ncbi:MAG: hypothetical protein LBH13_01880 [Cellulomonadaceae bacterium]|nr:hypothetical protein [Cellulomonadaceae bacterium]
MTVPEALVLPVRPVRLVIVGNPVLPVRLVLVGNPAFLDRQVSVAPMG